jgi:hypothetical protein
MRGVITLGDMADKGMTMRLPEVRGPSRDWRRQ